MLLSLDEGKNEYEKCQMSELLSLTGVYRVRKTRTKRLDIGAGRVYYFQP